MNIYNSILHTGGRIGKKACQAFEMLDLAKQPTPEWTTLPELSVKLVFSCYVANDNHFYRLGGLQETQQNTLPKFDESVSEFDIEEGEWPKKKKKKKERKKNL